MSHRIEQSKDLIELEKERGKKPERDLSHKFAVQLVREISELERVKILYQVQGMNRDKPKKYKGLVQTIRTVVEEEGVRSLWKGNGANCVRVVPNYMCKFTFNDLFKDMVRQPGSTGPLSFNQMLVAGTAAGLVQICVTYPLELVRTRLSLGESMAKGVKYKGIFDCFKRTVQHEGPKALYKGIGPTFLSGAPYTGLQMSSYDYIKRHLPVNGNNGQQSHFWALCAGALSGLFSQTLTYPGDTLRRRMQANGLEGVPRIYKNTWHCLTTIFQKEGALALFSGCQANIVRAVPGTAIQFWSYETIKSLLGVEPISGG